MNFMDHGDGLQMLFGSHVKLNYFLVFYIFVLNRECLSLNIENAPKSHYGQLYFFTKTLQNSQKAVKPASVRPCLLVLCILGL